MLLKVLSEEFWDEDVNILAETKLSFFMTMFCDDEGPKTRKIY